MPILWSRKSHRARCLFTTGIWWSDTHRLYSFSPSRTATADGQYMAKILSTFSKIEQSRFEAFKRVAFPTDTISDYVAHCLAERQQHQRPEPNYHHSKSLFASSSGDGGKAAPRLQDLVVPGQEEEITTVVATLAKVYAQRLCAAAKAHAQTLPKKTGDSSESNGALQPEHILHAFYARKEQGQDPGFFLQPNEGLTIPNNGKEQMKRVAALAAQEDFDRVLEEYEKEEKAKKESVSDQQSKSDKTTTNTTPMEEDSDSGDEEEVELDMEKEMEKEMGDQAKSEN